MKNEDYGARIERGEIIEAQNDMYRVKSITRDGVQTPFLDTMGNQTYAMGDQVYFFMFDDGKGKILAGL